jgi:hypothetical protein
MPQVASKMTIRASADAIWPMLRAGEAVALLKGALAANCLALKQFLER